MADNIHPVVELLAARMESHPEEFPVNPTGQLPVSGRWSPWLAQAEHLMNDAERTLIYTKAKEIIFGRIHEEVLDELLNGPERRAEERRARDAEMQKLILTKQQLLAQAQANAQVYGTNMQSSLATLQTALPAGTTITQDYLNDCLRISNGGTSVTSISRDELENHGFVATMKKALGL